MQISTESSRSIGNMALFNTGMELFTLNAAAGWRLSVELELELLWSGNVILIDTDSIILIHGSGMMNLVNMNSIFQKQEKLK